MATAGLEMKSRRRRDSLGVFAQLVRNRTMVPRLTGAPGQAHATRVCTDRPPYVCLRALPARGSLRGDVHPDTPIVLTAPGPGLSWEETEGPHRVTMLAGQPTGARLDEAIRTALASNAAGEP